MQKKLFIFITGKDAVFELRSELKSVEDIAKRVSIDATSIQSKLMDIESKSEGERILMIEKLRENLALLVDDMADELTKMAIKLNPNRSSEEIESSAQKLKDRKSKSRSLSDSSDIDSDQSTSQRILRKVKRRRKITKSQAERSSTSTDLSSNSEDVVDKGTLNVKDEPFVISQNIDDLMNGASNESIRKQTDFLGFGNDDDNDDDGFEIGIKTEFNDTLSSQLPTSPKNASQSNSSPNDKYADIDENSQIINNKGVEREKKQPTENSAIGSMEVNAEHSSSLASVSDNNDDDVEESDEDIRRYLKIKISINLHSFIKYFRAIFRLLDFKSIESKRIASTAAAAKLNGIVEPKKPEPKKKPPKEDGLEKILADSLDTEQMGGDSDEEKEDGEEYTEEHFLKEQNEQYKEQLLLTSDSELGSESDERMNGNFFIFQKSFSLESKILLRISSIFTGKGSDFDFDEDSNSNESLVGKFLADELNESDQNVSNETNKEKKSKENKIVSDSKKEVKSKTKESSPNENEDENIDRFDEDLDESEFEFDESESGSVSEAPRKSKSTIGKNVFSNIEKEKHIVIPSDGDDASGNELKKKPTSDKRKSDADSSEKDSDILDTTMFKSNKKDYTHNQLSKKLVQANRNKQSTSRISPECISVSSDDFEIECTSVEKKTSSNNNNNNDDDEVEEKEKRGQRKLLRHDQLADDTKLAQREESDRIKRLDKKNERLSQFMESQRKSQSQSQERIDPNAVILDVDTKKDEKIFVHSEITKHLKPHQVEGIKFMYDCCYGSVDSLEKYPGSGCILAHCMGLGKTLQLITLLHTVICYPQLKTDKVIVICPKSTVMNWKEEIERWLGNIKNTRRLKLFHFPEQS